ncbi:nucleotide-diphospho-sugar transferase [Trametopsis cervina]|nr:nucleotide-diphospho-sugar transferase [Trametopsis cervina]
MDIYGSHPGLPQKRRPWFVVSLLIFVASVVFNIIFVVKYLWRAPRPLDDYQHLNLFPIVENSLPNASDGQHAVVTTLYTDSYAPAVATLGHSLRKVNTTARLIVLYFPSVISPSALCLATASGFEPVPVTRVAPPNDGNGMNAHFADVFTKLSLWGLDTMHIESLVYLDADTLVVRNFDELFHLPYTFAAAPDVWEDDRGMTLEFNSGVLFLKPNSAVYENMLSVLPYARFPGFYADQAFLLQYFAGRTLTLPPIYNANLATKKRYPQLWSGMHDEMRIIHYTLAKPFIGRSFRDIPLESIPERVQEAARSQHGLYYDEVILWGTLWEETQLAYSHRLQECGTR